MSALATSSSSSSCPVSLGLVESPLVPWPGIRYACLRVLHLYCKVFNQTELYEFIVRKTCSSCKCPKDSHDLFHDEWLSIRDSLGLAQTATTADPFISRLGRPPPHPGYTWAPPNLTDEQITEFFRDFQPEYIPKTGTPGELYRDKQILHQIPKQV